MALSSWQVLSEGLDKLLGLGGVFRTMIPFSVLEATMECEQEHGGILKKILFAGPAQVPKEWEDVLLVKRSKPPPTIRHSPRWRGRRNHRPRPFATGAEAFAINFDIIPRTSLHNGRQLQLDPDFGLANLV